MEKILLFDLDGTLLGSDKSISPLTLNSIEKCKDKGFLIGVSTARSEINSLKFLKEVEPDIIISSGGALVSYKGKNIYKAEFSLEETKRIIGLARELGGQLIEITVDTVNCHYWNYSKNPLEDDPTWGDTTYSDYIDFNEKSLKICVELGDEDRAKKLAEQIEHCHYVRFSDGNWFKFSKSTGTKDKGIIELSKFLNIDLNDIVAFGDDFADIEMLKICGKGIAMGNAIEAVKAIADEVIDTNDNDGIAKYLLRNYFIITELKKQ